MEDNNNLHQTNDLTYYESVDKKLIDKYNRLFKKGKPIYEIIRNVKDTSIISDNGIREVYVNLKAKASDKKLQSLFNIMMTVDDVDEKSFPVLSKKKEEINDLYIGGDQNMAGLDLVMYKDGLRIGKKEGRLEGREEGIQQSEQQAKKNLISLLVRGYKSDMVDIGFAAKELGITEKEFIKLVNDSKD